MLKGLEDVVGLSVVDPIRDVRGWAFREAPGATGDPINGFEYLSEAYERSLPGYDDRYSVPVLWDRETGQIINNESSEIIVMLDGAFNEWAAHPEVELYPAALRVEIDEINDWVYSGLNNGVYRVGFAASQEAYDEAIAPLFETLDRMEALLGERRYLAGSQHTLADWRAFPTLMRFDLVYHGLFRANRRRLIDYENLWPYLRDLYQTPGVAATVDFDHFIRGYNLNLPSSTRPGSSRSAPGSTSGSPTGASGSAEPVGVAAEERGRAVPLAGERCVAGGRRRPSLMPAGRCRARRSTSCRAHRARRSAPAPPHPRRAAC